MKCPLKKIETYKDYYGSKCSKNASTLSKIQIDFGECDGQTCMAYNPSTNMCRLMNKNKEDW